MRVSEYDEFDDLDYNRALLSGTGERNWLWLGLIVSLGLHIALCTYFIRTRFQSVESVVLPNQPTMMFKVKNDRLDRKSTRLNSSHVEISYAVFCLKKKTT